MKLYPLAVVLPLLFAAGCDRQGDPAQAKSGAAPTTASAGAGTPAPANPARENVTPAPTPSAKDATTKPDPGDANDHSAPNHDAREKSSGASTSEN